MNALQFPRRAAAGFTIIELMIGMVVGLIATVVMFQVFAVSEGQKRTTTGAGDAQQNGVGSVFAIERDARMAGFGLSYPAAAGCYVQGYSQEKSADIAFRLAPFTIINGVAGASDRLTLAYGDTRNFASPEKLIAKMVGGGDNYKLENPYGFTPGDVIIAAQEVGPCTMAQVRVRAGTDSLDHAAGNYIDAGGVSRSTRYNTGKFGTGYPEWNRTTQKGGRVMNLGQNPVVVTYYLDGTVLKMHDELLPSAIPAAEDIIIADNIVQFQAQYAYDGNADSSIDATAVSVAIITGGVDQWGDAMPNTPLVPGSNPDNNWGNIIGIRFAIVARSVSPERPDPGTGQCTATTVSPVWGATGANLDVVTSNPTEWKCYRYRVFEVTVPSRNRIWAPDEKL